MRSSFHCKVRAEIRVVVQCLYVSAVAIWSVVSVTRTSNHIVKWLSMTLFLPLVSGRKQALWFSQEVNLPCKLTTNWLMLCMLRASMLLWNLDWLTVSPKGSVVVTKCNELKCIFDGESMVDDAGIQADYYYLQPCDVGDKVKNQVILQACISYILSHPKWRLSLQTHKMIGIQ